MVPPFNNKWPAGKVSWRAPPLPSHLDQFSGIVPLRVVLDLQIGSEVALFIVDRTAFAQEIAQLDPFRLNLNAGIIPCPSGPVFFLLYWLKQPISDGPFVMFENTLNPHDLHHIEIYWDLARQTHWHVFVLGEGNRELNWFEFENLYQLDVTLNRVAEMIVPYPALDFNLAKAEFEAAFSMDDLFRIGTHPQ